MIPVQRAPEPADFDDKVRLRGLSAIDELVGRKPRRRRRGRKRKQVATREADIPAKKFPAFWRDALPEMLDSYERRCAFLAMYLEHATGNASVDHMLPKSRRWDKVYEWSNYRLCAAFINAKKSDLEGIVDPFLCHTGWFALELTAFQVTVGPAAPADQKPRIEKTLTLLNSDNCLKQRETYFEEYQNGHIDLDYLRRRAPFIEFELRRQSKLRPGDD